MKINSGMSGLYIMIFGSSMALCMGLLFLDTGWKYIPPDPIFAIPAAISLIGLALVIIPKLVGEIK